MSQCSVPGGDPPIAIVGLALGPGTAISNDADVCLEFSAAARISAEFSPNRMLVVVRRLVAIRVFLTPCQLVNGKRRENDHFRAMLRSTDNSYYAQVWYHHRRCRPPCLPMRPSLQMA
jgi:hypothetical protein